MKELTIISTIEVTDIKKLSDEEYDVIMNNTDVAKQIVQETVKKLFNCYDIHMNVQIFVRNDDDD